VESPVQSDMWWFVVPFTVALGRLPVDDPGDLLGRTWGWPTTTCGWLTAV